MMTERLAPSALGRLALIAGIILLAPASAQARDSLGVFSDWGAFRDPVVPRCYAIAMAIPSTLDRDYQPFATVGTWPRRGVRGQVHFRMSRKLAKNPRLSLRIGGETYRLAGGGGDAWAEDRKMDAAILARMRSASQMTVSATGANGKRFSNSWMLQGAASAMDAATLGCAKLK